MAFAPVDKRLLARFRTKMKQLGPTTTQREKSEAMTSFEGITQRQAVSYVAACDVSDYVFGLYLDDKFTFKMLLEIASAQLDEATRDFLARAVVERKLTTAQLMKAKLFLRKKCSMAEALAKAVGQIPAEDTKPSERPANADTLNDEIMKLGTTWRIKVQMAMDLLPVTSLEGKSARMLIFKKAYELRHLVREQLAFIDNKVEQFLKEMETHATAEAVVAAQRGMTVYGSTGGSYEHDPGDGGHDGEAACPPVGEAE